VFQWNHSFTFSSDDCKHIIISYSNQVKLNYLQDLKESGWEWLCWSMWNNTSTKNRCTKEYFERNEILLRLKIYLLITNKMKRWLSLYYVENLQQDQHVRPYNIDLPHTHTLDSTAQISFQISKIQNQHCWMTYRRDIFVM